MDVSDTNRPFATEAAPTSSSGVESSEKALENTAPAVEATTSVTATHSWPSPDSSKAAMLHHWMRQSIVAQTHLHEDMAALIAFWILSTWFQDAVTVLPCLVISGASHDAVVVLRMLEAFCREPLLAAEFRRGDLENFAWNCRTLLMLEPNLDNRKAVLLGNLTNPGFRIVAAGRRLDCSKSRAIYIGMNPATQQIQNAIHITIPPRIQNHHAPLRGCNRLSTTCPATCVHIANRVWAKYAGWSSSPPAFPARQQRSPSVGLRIR